jgi:hypothetical protein
MELPDDVLGLIREYAKPRFKYFKEYNTSMRVLGMKNWVVLKENMHTNPETVLPALGIYLDAFVNKKTLYQEREELKKKSCISDQDLMYMHHRMFYAKRTEEDVFWMLVRILYGDRHYWNVREDVIPRSFEFHRL